MSLRAVQEDITIAWNELEETHQNLEDLHSDDEEQHMLIKTSIRRVEKALHLLSAHTDDELIKELNR